MKRILVVEDEFVTASEIQARLIDNGFDVPRTVFSGEDAIVKAELLKPDLVIMDITLKGEMSGIDAARIIKERFQIPVIFLTAHSDEKTIDSAVSSEPFGYLIKPLDERSLMTAIKMAFYKHAMEKALITSEKRYRAIAELSEDIILILETDGRVLFMNQAGLAFVHRPHVEQENLRDIFPPRLADQVLAFLQEIDGERKSTLIHPDEGRYLELEAVIAREGTEQVILHCRDVTGRILLEEEMKQQGVHQIERNMEQFQILSDKIRNPLAILMMLANQAGPDMAKQIITQIECIDKTITALDQRWLESEKVREYLLRHHGFGERELRSLK